MDLYLYWRGPVRSGNFPIEADAIEIINQPGVYLRLKLYENERVIAYVGQSMHLVTRFDQHLTRLLSLQQTLRDGDGLAVEFQNAENRFATLNEIKAVGPMAIEEALRTQFYFALAQDGFDADYLTLIEARLKARAEDLMQEKPENIQTINPGEFDHNISIISDFSNVDAVGRTVIESVVGATPIEIGAEHEEFVDAD